MTTSHWAKDRLGEASEERAKGLALVVPDEDDLRVLTVIEELDNNMIVKQGRNPVAGNQALVADDLRKRRAVGTGESACVRTARACLVKSVALANKARSI